MNGSVPRQLQLSIDFRPAPTREDFLVAPCNRAAVAWIDRWPDWAAPAMCLVGPRASGKSHLAAVWRARTGAPATSGDRLGTREPSDWLDARGCLVIEDADRGLDETAAFHLYNMAHEAGGSLLFTAAAAPSRWDVTLPDLRSRLGAVMVAEIAAPDDALLGGLLIKLFNDRQTSVTPEVVAYLLARMERSFAEARRLVDVLDRTAIDERRRVTVPLARRVLALPRMAAAGGTGAADPFHT